MPSKRSSVSWFIVCWKPCWHFKICPWTDKHLKSSNAAPPIFESPIATVLMSMKDIHDYQTSRCRITVRRWPISQRCTCKQRCYWRNSSVAHLLMAAGTVPRANICHQSTEPWKEIATAAAQDLGWDSGCGNSTGQSARDSDSWDVFIVKGSLHMHVRMCNVPLLLGAPRTVSR